MSEIRELPMTYATHVEGRPLGLRAAVLVDRLADVVEDLDSQDPHADSTVAFLRGWAEEARGAALPGDGSGHGQQPLDLLVQRFALTPEEHDLVVLAGLAEEHEGLAGTFRALHPLGEPRPSVGLAGLVLAEAGRDELRRLLAEGPAVGSGVLVVEGSGVLPERSLRLADRLWEVLHGVDARPAGLGVVTLDDVVPGLDEWLEEDAVEVAARAVLDRSAVTILVAGDDPVVSTSRATALLASVGASAFAVRAHSEDGHLSAAEMALADVHAVARDLVLVLLAGNLDPGAGPLDLPALPHLSGPVVVVAPAGRVRPHGRRPVLWLPATLVSPAASRLAWRVLLPDLDQHAADAIASRTPVDPAWVAGIAGDVAASGLAPSPHTVASAVRCRTGSTLPPGAVLTRPHVGWEHLVLPPAAEAQLRDAVDRLDHQARVLEAWGMAMRAHASRGVRLLFTGPPGTGKTLAAEVLATAAGTDLLHMDLSQVVSKWLGETEKNLAAAFAAAERTQAVLLFDEADALFASRTDVSDAHDRYANLETAYLLQRMESFGGLAVLTTNLRHNIDEAFVRRMDFVVDFPTPDEPSRRRLWDLHLPADHLGADVGADALARMYPVAGAWIRNAALAASYVAAAADEDVHQHHLTAAIRREYGKASLPYPGDPPRRTP